LVALLNGTFARTMDFDDTYVLGALQPGAPMIPAALTATEQVDDASGRALRDAIEVGYEVVFRVGATLFADSVYDRGFHATSAGIFGTVAAVGRARRMPSGLPNACTI